LSTVLEDGSTGNLATGLARELTSWLDEGNDPIKVSDSTNLSQVAQIVERVHSRDELTSEVRDYYKQHADSLGKRDDPTFQRLAALPFPLFLTSRHDATLQWYLEKGGKQPSLKCYDFKGDRKATLGNLGTSQQPVIYHLYGCTDDPGSMVITENDILEFLKSVVAGNPGLPADLLDLFQNKNFLFLGSGLGDYQLRVLLHDLNLNKEKMSFALENTPSAGEQQRFQQKFGDSVLFYGHLGYKLKLLDTRLDAFVEELNRRWTERHPEGFKSVVSLEASGETDAQSAEGPSVFISYVKEDEDRAKQLSSDLGKEGLNPWLDTETLRSGMDWDKKLEDAVSKDVDFFIVLQSKALSQRTESFVHKEVDLALKRAILRPPGRPFIFPVKLDDDAELLEALDKIQTSTLFDWPADVKKLAGDIKRASERQKRG
jgi:hypothetical protein